MRSTLKIINHLWFKALFLLVIALVPRIFGLGEHSIFADEITWMARSKDVYANVRSGMWDNFKTGWWLDKNNSEPIGLPMAFLGGVSMTFLSPGYSHYSLNIMRDFAAARLPAVILGTLFIPAFYLLLKKFTGERVAFAAAFFMALDPIAIGLSRWLHQDMALLAFSTIGLLLYFFSDRKVAIICSALLTSMAILTKPQGLLVVVAVLMALLISLVKKEKVNFKKLLSWVLLSFFFTFISFPFLWQNPIGGMAEYLSTQFVNAESGQFTFFNGQITSAPPWYYYFSIFPFRLPESILIGFVFGLFLVLVSIKRKLKISACVRAIAIYYVLFLAVVSLSNKKVGIRYLFGLWPYIYLLAAYGLIYIEKFFAKSHRWIFWLAVVVFPVWGILKFYPSFYLFHNHFISPQKFQNLESVGYCDSVKPAIEYLEPKLYHGIPMMYAGCDSAINYYTGFTIYRKNNVNEAPEYIIEETHDAQKYPDTVKQIQKAGYAQIRSIDFRGINLAKIYQKP